MTLAASLNWLTDLKDSLEVEATNQRMVNGVNMIKIIHSLVKYEENVVTEVNKRPNL